MSSSVIIQLFQHPFELRPELEVFKNLKILCRSDQFTNFTPGIVDESQSSVLTILKKKTWIGSDSGLTKVQKYDYDLRLRQRMKSMNWNRQQSSVDFIVSKWAVDNRFVCFVCGVMTWSDLIGLFIHMILFSADRLLLCGPVVIVVSAFSVVYCCRKWHFSLHLEVGIVYCRSNSIIWSVIIWYLYARHDMGFCMPI